MKLKYDIPLLYSAFKSNSRRYIKVPATLEGVKAANALVADGWAVKVETS